MVVTFKLFEENGNSIEYAISDDVFKPFGRLGLTLEKNQIGMSIDPVGFLIAEILIEGDTSWLEYIEAAYNKSLALVRKIAKKHNITKIYYCTEREFFLNVLLKLRPWQPGVNSNIDKSIEVAKQFPKIIASVKTGQQLNHIVFKTGAKANLHPSLENIKTILTKKFYG